MESNNRPTAPQIAQRIREARAASGLGPTAYADLIGVSKSTIWKWEHGRIPMDALLLIAAMGGVRAAMDRP